MQLTTLAQIHGLNDVRQNDNGSITSQLPSMPDYSINIKYLTDSEYVDVYLRIELDQSYSGAGCGAWEVPVELLALALRQVEAFVKVYDEILEAAA